jgi:hypothetical protein
MYTIILLALLTLAPLIAHAGDVRCTTKEDPQFQRWVTECTDGARAITKYDEPFQRYRTDITKAPQGDRPPLGWPKLGKAPH